MASGLDWLLKLDSLAERPGDGLHPKLAELLQDRCVTTSPKVVQLPAFCVSSGPDEQIFSPDELKAAGIPTIGNSQRSTDETRPSSQHGVEWRDGKPVQNQN